MRQAGVSTFDGKSLEPWADLAQIGGVEDH